MAKYMKTIVLIHGAWHGAWCWYKVVPLLEQHGYRVITPDLPGHGRDRTPLSDVTLELYTDRICRLITELDGPVVLLGHSMSGIVISRVAERIPESISKLVYLTGFMLENGVSLLDTALADNEAVVEPNLIISRDRISATLSDEHFTQAFYLDCSPQEIEFAIANVTPQALAPFAEPVIVSEENWGSVPRSYIECTLDNAITIKAQREMYHRYPCDPVLTMDTAHSPFFSAPEKLVENILLCAGDN